MLDLYRLFNEEDILTTPLWVQKMKVKQVSPVYHIIVIKPFYN